MIDKVMYLAIGLGIGYITGRVKAKLKALKGKLK